MTEDRVPPDFPMIGLTTDRAMIEDRAPTSCFDGAWPCLEHDEHVRLPASAWEPLLGCYGGIPHRCSRCGFEIPAGTVQSVPPLDVERLGAAMEQTCDALSVHSLSPADAPALLARLVARDD